MAGRSRTRVILDVDTGTDDAVALMTAALSPDLELVGATTVNGNTTIDNTTENTLRVFDWIGLPDMPVHRGMAQPLARTQMEQRNPASRIHGSLLDLPPASKAKLQPGHAVDWLIETYLASDGDIVLCPVGPLTNIATAIQKEPAILAKIPEIVIMGGAHDHGNATASAEFNIWLDPEAARIVVNCGRPIRMIPLDATHRALVSTEDAGRLRALGTPAGEAAARFVLKRIDGYDATQPMGRRRAGPRRARGVLDHRPLDRDDGTHPGRRRGPRGAVGRANGVRLPLPERPVRQCRLRDRCRRAEVRLDAAGYPRPNGLSRSAASLRPGTTGR